MLWLISGALATPICDELLSAEPKSAAISTAIADGVDYEAFCYWTGSRPDVHLGVSLVPLVGVGIVALSPRRSVTRSERPVALAIKRNSPALTTLLLDAGARLPLSAVQMAIDADSWDTLPLLLERGARPEVHKIPPSLSGNTDQLATFTALGLTLEDVTYISNEERIVVDRPTVQAFLDAGLPADDLIATAGEEGPVDVVSALLERGEPTGLEAVEGLSRAALNGRWTVVDVMRDVGVPLDPDPSMVESSGPLHDAALLGDTQAVLGLLERGASIDAVENNGQTPLFHAVLSGERTVVDLLLARGADVNRTTAHGETALSAAIDEDARTLTYVLLDHGAIFGPAELNAVLEDDELALLKRIWRPSNPSAPHAIALAVRHDARQCFDYLIANDAVIEGGTYETSGLSAAVEQSSTAWVERLETLGASLADLPDPERSWKAVHRDDTFVSTLLEKGFPPVPSQAFTALSRQEYARVEEMLGQGLDPNTREGSRKTLLSEAIDSGEVSLVRLLLQLGADPRQEVRGEPVTRRALDSAEILVLLVEAGADPNWEDPFRRTLLHHMIDDPATIEQLLLLGANPNLPEDHPKTPLRMALASRHPDETVPLLLAHGADPNQSWALHDAIRRYQYRFLVPFLKAGADPLLKDSGQTPMRIATREDHADAVVELLKGGAPLDSDAIGYLAAACALTTLETYWSQRDVTASALALARKRAKRSGCDKRVWQALR